MLVEYLAKWLAGAHYRLWGAFGGVGFSFAQAMECLALPEATALKVLSDLGQRGALLVKRGKVDERAKEYKLVSPGDRDFVQTVQAMLSGSGFKERVRVMGERLPYLVGGDHAVMLYTRWLFTAEKELLVKAVDFEKWFAYLKDRETVVLYGVVTRVPKQAKEFIHLVAGLDDGLLARAREVGGLKVLGPEDLVPELIESGFEEGFEYALAVLVKQGKGVDWRALKARATEKNVAGDLRELLAVANKEAGKRVFPVEAVNRFKGKPRKQCVEAILGAARKVVEDLV